MIGNRSHTMTWGALVMVIPVLFYQKLWHRVTRWVPECRPNSHPLKLSKYLAHPTLCNRTPWYAHSWFVDGQCVDDATPAHATIWSVTWDHWSCSPTPGGSVRVERVFADGGRVTACNESPWWDRWCFVDEVCLSHVLTWQGEALIPPLFFEGSCRRRWGSGISLKQGTLIEKWIPGFMCVTYRSRESITKYPTGFTGTESSICSGYWNFSCQIVQYSPSSRGWRRFGVGRFMLWA